MIKKINGSVPLYFWSGHNNFGDQMSKDVLEFSLKMPVVHVPEVYKGKFIAIGSVLDKSTCDDVIWGAGVHPRFYREGDRFDSFLKATVLKKRFQCVMAKVLAVRGPITRQFIIQNGGEPVDVMGDPAILAPRIYAKRINPIRKHLLINHFSVESMPSHNCTTVSAEKKWQEVVDSICESEIVISSSLHGLILAEAYGVPAVFLRNSREGLIKYLDYYGATGRFPIIVNSMDEALAIKNPACPPCFDQIADGLLLALNTWMREEDEKK